MDAAVWTLIAVLAAGTFGNVWWLGTRIDQVRTDLGARIDANGARIDANSARIDALGASLNARIDETNARIDETNARIDEINARIGGLERQFVTHLEAHRTQA